MLVEIGIGDAYGAGFEMAKPSRLLEIKNDLKTYYQHNLPGFLPPGSYTDDTQMSIGIAEYMLDTDHWTEHLSLDIANKWVEVYKRDPRNGYSRKFQAILDEISNGKELLEKIVPNSNKCGAAMRSCPIGYLPRVYNVLTFSRIQAKITHDTPEGIASSQIIAMASHYFIYDKGPKKDLLRFLEVVGNYNLFFENRTDFWPLNQYCTSDAIPCVKAAISAVVRNSSLSECLKECIDYKGDVDSVAAMAVGIASCSKEVVNDLPKNLYDGLENGFYGLDYLKNLDNQLENLRAKNARYV